MVLWFLRCKFLYTFERISIRCCCPMGVGVRGTLLSLLSEIIYHSQVLIVDAILQALLIREINPHGENFLQNKKRF